MVKGSLFGPRVSGSGFNASGSRGVPWSIFCFGASVGSRVSGFRFSRNP